MSTLDERERAERRGRLYNSPTMKRLREEQNAPKETEKDRLLNAQADARAALDVRQSRDRAELAFQKKQEFQGETIRGYGIGLDLKEKYRKLEDAQNREHAKQKRKQRDEHRGAIDALRTRGGK